MSIVNCKCKEENGLARNFVGLEVSLPPSPKGQERGCDTQSRATSRPPAKDIKVPSKYVPGRIVRSCMKQNYLRLAMLLLSRSARIKGSVADVAWEDAEFLKQFDEKGEKISVQDGDQKTQNLTAIRTKSPESAKP